MAKKIDLKNEFSEENIRKAYEIEGEKLGRVNIAVLGATGVGKTTLLNQIFGREISKIGQDGKPTTKKLRYHRYNNYLGIWDTVGFELDKLEDELLSDIESQIDNPTYDVQRPHAIWYCVGAYGGNVSTSEFSIIKRLAALKIPVFVVITQAQSKKGKLSARTQVKVDLFTEKRIPIATKKPFIVCVKTEPDAGMHEVFGLKELVGATFQTLSGTAASESFAAAQTVDLGIKDKTADNAIKVAAGIAAGIGASPIPMSDAALLVPTQLALMAKIAHIYDIDINRATMATLAATGAARAAGTSLVGNILKWIPGLNLAGMFINAGVASSFTYAMGKSWKYVCKKIFLGEIPPKYLEKADFLSDLFMAQFKKNYK